MAERRLADSRRAGEGENGGLRLLDQGTNRQELEDAFLDLLEAVVILVQDFFGPFQVAALTGLFLPGHGNQPVQVVTRDRGFSRHRRHRFQALKLLNRFLLDVLRHLGRLDLLLQVVDLVALFILAAQFLLDRLHLLVEVVLLLRLLHLLLDARLDAAVYLELVDLDFENAGNAIQTFDRRNDLEQILLLVDADEQMRRNGIGELAGVVNADRRDHRVVMQVVRQLHVLLEERDHAAHRAFDVAAGFPLFRQHLDDDPVEAFVFLPLDGAGAVDAFDQHLDVAVGQLQALDDVGDAAHRVDVFRRGSSTDASCWAARKIRLSLSSACSSARVELGRPMTNGIIMCGKTTTSRNGTIGSVS